MDYSDKIIDGGMKVNGKNEFPSRQDLDEAFHFLQDQITRISVVEEEEMTEKVRNGKSGRD
jgi:hypothetical protein